MVSVGVLRMFPEEDANPQEAQTVHPCPQMLPEMHWYRTELPLTLLESHRYSQARSAQRSFLVLAQRGLSGAVAIQGLSQKEEAEGEVVDQRKTHQ